MHLNGTSMESSIASEFSDAWVLPAALQQLEESGDADLVQELIEIFQTDTAERLELLARALETGDYATARAEAHTVKGSALQVGAVRVADVCRQMEVEAGKAQPADLAPMFRTLRRSFEEVCGVISASRLPATDGPPRHGQ